MIETLRQAVRDLNSGLANQVVRARHVLSAYSKDASKRTMVQLTGFDGETHQDVELILPYGMSALPVGKTADLIVFQVNATRDHKVALGADDPALRIPDLGAGEFGFRDSLGQQVVFRKTKIEVTSPTKDIAVTAGQGNVNVTATQGTIALSSKGNLNVTVGAGNLNLSVTGNAVVAATGKITLTGQAGQITANGNVLG